MALGTADGPVQSSALLKNSGNALPLAPATKTVAVIGPNANLSKADTSYYGPRAACGNNCWCAPHPESTEVTPESCRPC